VGDGVLDNFGPIEHFFRGGGNQPMSMLSFSCKLMKETNSHQAKVFTSKGKTGQTRKLFFFSGSIST